MSFWLATDNGPRRVCVPYRHSVAFFAQERRAFVESLLRQEPDVELRPLDLHDFHHRPVMGLYCRSHRRLMDCARRLRDVGVDVYEADIRPPERYLMERFITAPVCFVDGAEHSGASFVQLKPAADYRPRLRLVSLDIETTARSDLYSHCSGGLRPASGLYARSENGDASAVDFS